MESPPISLRLPRAALRRRRPRYRPALPPEAAPVQPRAAPPSGEGLPENRSEWGWCPPLRFEAVLFPQTRQPPQRTPRKKDHPAHTDAQAPRAAVPFGESKAPPEARSPTAPRRHATSVPSDRATAEARRLPCSPLPTAPPQTANSYPHHWPSQA